MESQIEEIEKEIHEAKLRRKNLILEAMDGRTQRSLAEKTGIDVTKLSKWVNGTTSLEEYEIEKLSKILGVGLK